MGNEHDPNIAVAAEFDLFVQSATVRDIRSPGDRMKGPFEYEVMLAGHRAFGANGTFMPEELKMVGYDDVPPKVFTLGSIWKCTLAPTFRTLADVDMSQADPI